MPLEGSYLDLIPSLPESSGVKSGCMIQNRGIIEECKMLRSKRLGKSTT